MSVLEMNLFNNQQKAELEKVEGELLKRMADPDLQWWMMEAIRVASSHGLNLDEEIKQTKTQEEAYTLVYEKIKGL